MKDLLSKNLQFSKQNRRILNRVPHVFRRGGAEDSLFNSSRRVASLSLCVFGFGCFIRPAVAVTPITTESLLDDMVDLQRLTRLSDPPYTTKQFSSYDRSSKSPADGWFANNDWGNFLRMEDNGGRKEYVMMDADGPGAIVRIWSANPKGTLRIYIDGAATPVLEAAMDQVLGGRVPGLPVPITGERSRGWNLYFPIPYARHCKVTSDDGTFFYHVNYRTYVAGTTVESYTPAVLERLQPKIAKIAAKLSSSGAATSQPAQPGGTSYKVTLAPGQDAVIFTQNGSKAIVNLLTHLLAKDIDAAARSVVVYMAFDGQNTVECPIGDFFGTAPGLRPYASLPLAIGKSNVPDLCCHWWMPFAKHAQIRVKNFGSQDVVMDGAVSTVDYQWDDRSMHFHAGWRQAKRILTRPMTDWTHLECRGTGRFVGGMLHVQNPLRTWWGEGDEKIYVDGETFPSHFGTGTEDYYGYAYCATQPFGHAYHNQTRCDGPANFGNTSVNRFHILDDIPFTRSFKFEMETWNAAEETYSNRAAASYWYARPGGDSDYRPLTEADLQLEPMTMFRVAGVQEGELLTVIAKTAGRARKEEKPGNQGWSDGRQLMWREAAPGETMTLAFQADAGRKRVFLNLSKSSDSGVFHFRVNGRKAGPVVDLYAPTLTTSVVDLGVCKLRQGVNELGVEILNPPASRACSLGLDYLRVE